MTYRFTPQAEMDLFKIADYIAEDDEVAALAWIDRIEQCCMTLSDNPMIGPARNDIAIGLRYLPVKNYLILYRLIDSHIEIVRIIHGSRDLNNIFTQ